MNKNGLGTHIVTQIGIVVKDIEKTSEAFSRILGLPKPPISITGGESARAVNRGKPTTAQAKLAFFNLGQVAIELIEPMGGDSVWQEVLDEREKVCIISPSMSRVPIKSPITWLSMTYLSHNKDIILGACILMLRVNPS